MPEYAPGFQITSRITDISERMRLLEERINQIRDKLNVVDKTLIDKSLALKEGTRKLEIQIDEIRKNIKTLSDTMQNVIKELDHCARAEDLKVLEKYVNMIDPTRLVTREEVQRIIEESK